MSDHGGTPQTIARLAELGVTGKTLERLQALDASYEHTKADALEDMGFALQVRGLDSEFLDTKAIAGFNATFQSAVAHMPGFVLSVLVKVRKSRGFRVSEVIAQVMQGNLGHVSSPVASKYYGLTANLTMTPAELAQYIVQHEGDVLRTLAALEVERREVNARRKAEDADWSARWRKAGGE